MKAFEALAVLEQLDPTTEVTIAFGKAKVPKQDTYNNGFTGQFSVVQPLHIKDYGLDTTSFPGTYMSNVPGH